jgi:predicted Zn-ribbon and HTH transcriptional regulator
MAEIMLKGFRCERCEHTWIPRNEEERPTVCPKCKSPYWDKPRSFPSGKNLKKKSGKLK